MRFTLLTYNIHKGIGGVDRRYRPERIAETIEHYAPDVVLLQEVDDGVPRSRRHRQVDWLADRLQFPHRVFQPNVTLRYGAYGNAILSRWRMEETHDVELTVWPKKRRRAQIVKFRLEEDVPGQEAPVTRTLIVSNLHLGLARFERKLQMRRLLLNDVLRHAHQDTPTIIAGDFNDVWQNLANGMTGAEQFQSALGAARTFPAIYPLRSLDGIYYRGALRMERSFVGHIHLARQASDHLPAIAEFQITSVSS